MVLRQVSALKLLLLSALLHAIQYRVAGQTICELKSHTHLHVYYMYKIIVTMKILYQNAELLKYELCVLC